MIHLIYNRYLKKGHTKEKTTDNAIRQFKWACKIPENGKFHSKVSKQHLESSPNSGSWYQCWYLSQLLLWYIYICYQTYKDVNSKSNNSFMLLTYLLTYYAIYSLHSILPLIPTGSSHTAHIWPYSSSQWWLNKMAHCYGKGKLAKLTKVWPLDQISFWHQDTGPVNAQVELPWWQWSAVLLGRLHLQEQEPRSGLQDDDHL